MTVYHSGRQPFFSAVQIILLIAIEGPLHLKPRLQNEYTYDYEIQIAKTVPCLKADKMQSACFFSTHSLSSIEQKKQSEHSMKELHGLAVPRAGDRFYVTASIRG